MLTMNQYKTFIHTFYSVFTLALLTLHINFLMQPSALAAKSTWIIRQTTFSVQHPDKSDQEGIAKEKYACACCQHFHNKPHQDNTGHRICNHCTKGLKAGTQQYGMGKNDVEQAATGTYYKQLFHILSIEPAHQTTAHHYIQKLAQEVDYHPEHLEFYTDKAFERDINTFKEKACITCQDCAATVSIMDVDAHAKEHQIQCDFCGFEPDIGTLSARQQAMATHDLTCSGSCRYCREELSKNIIVLHENGCLKKTAHCSGCDTDYTLEEHLPHVAQHFSVTSGSHSSIICPCCEHRVDNLDYQTHYDELHNPQGTHHCAYCETTFPCGSALLEHTQHQHTDEMYTLMQGHVDASADSEHKQHLVRVIDVFKKAQPTDKASTGDTDTRTDIEELTKLVKALEVTNERLKTELQTLTSGMTGAASSKAVVPATNSVSQINESAYSPYCQLSQQITALSNHVNHLEDSLKCLMASTYNGTFIWRVPDVSKRRKAAMDDTVTSIYSPSFYTDKHGYKVCIRAYLNGDGQGHETHLSVFIVLMQGEYDALLQWPFPCSVEFQLLNQNGGPLISMGFRPDSTPPFQRPSDSQNTATGCPLFTPLSTLRDSNYVKEDVMYIKCIINTSNVRHP